LLAVPGDPLRECATADEALRVADEFRPDCVTMDVRMPGQCAWPRPARSAARIPAPASSSSPAMTKPACASRRWRRRGGLPDQGQSHRTARRGFPRHARTAAIILNLPEK